MVARPDSLAEIDRGTRARPACGPHWPQLLLALACVAVALLVFRNRGMQAINWTYPFVSGAANLGPDLAWKISVSDFANASELGAEELRSYRFKSTPDTVPYAINNYGYLLVAWLARTIFGWLGDINALVALHGLAHMAVVATVWLRVLNSTAQRWSFVAIYGCNPAIVYLATFPFYYFWTVVPCLSFLVVTSGRYIGTSALVFNAVMLALGVLIRPTVVLVSLMAAAAPAVASPRIANRLAAACLAAAVAVFVLAMASGFKQSPYHTMYIGLGAYPNSAHIEKPVDEEGYRYYAKKTGIEISTRTIGGNYADPDTRIGYFKALKERYWEIARADPLLVVRNAAINLLQCFGLGYSTSSLALTVASSVLGGIVVVLFACRRQSAVLAAILAYSATYAWYFPPIPAYQYGAYLLVVVGLIRCFSGTVRGRNEFCPEGGCA